MPSPYTKDVQNAAKIGDAFDYGDMKVGSVAFAAATSSTATVTHGLTGTPDWIIANGSIASPLTLTANSTSVSFVRSATGAETVYYMIGDLV